MKGISFAWPIGFFVAGKALRQFAARMFLYAGVLASAAEALADEFLIPLRTAAEALAIQANGQVLVGHSGSISRLNKDGSIDEESGISLRSWPILAVANDGTVLAKAAGVTRIDWDLDLHVGMDPLFPGTSTRAFLLQPDGRVVLVEQTSIVRRNLDGTIDASFQAEPFSTPVPSPISNPVRLALQEDGKILVAGLPGGLIVRSNPDGTLDETFKAPAIDRVRAMLVQADGKIVLGASLVGDEARKGFVRLNVDGTLDAGFDPTFEHRMDIDALALQANGKIVAAGLFVSAEGDARTDIVRLNPDGTLDPDFPVGTFVAPAFSGIPLALEEDGSVLAGIVLGNGSNHVVRIANNEAAMQSFTREDATLRWMSSGSTPELYHTRFQASLDGIDWTDLGAGERIAGGWKLEGAEIPEGARFRIRGYVTGTSYHLDFVPGAPALYRDPADRTNNVNTEATFRVFAKGLEPLNYQWFKDGEALEGAQSSSLVLTNVTGEASGGYQVVVSNSEGSSTSRVATLTVVNSMGGGGDLRVGSPAYDGAERDLMLSINAPEGMIVLEMSTDLNQWTSLKTNAPGSPSIRLSGTSLPSPQAFFRLVRQN